MGRDEVGTRRLWRPLASNDVVPDRFQPVFADLAPLADRFATAGHRLYLVGGRVRDLMVGREMGAHIDLDLTTDALPAQIKQVLAGWADAMWTQGERFGTIGARNGDRDYEITTHRAEISRATRASRCVDLQCDGIRPLAS